LIVLVRNKPEEAVLTLCKSATSTLSPVYADGCAWGHSYDCVTNADS
jgi:hypothetical protein